MRGCGDAGRVRPSPEDEGQLILLVLAYTVIAALLITVVVDVSKAYLYRRSLVAAADGAALSAANQPDLGRGLHRRRTRRLPLSERRRAARGRAVRRATPSWPTGSGTSRSSPSTPTAWR